MLTGEELPQVEDEQEDELVTDEVIELEPPELPAVDVSAVIEGLRGEVKETLDTFGAQLSGLGSSLEGMRAHNEGRERKAARRVNYKRSKRTAARARTAASSSGASGDTSKSGPRKRLPFIK